MKDSIKEQIYQIIKGKILNQDYSLGEKISILSLSEELNVSNTPIREALSMLESEGLVIFKKNAGPSVININEKIFKEVSETISMLVLGAYEMCVAKNKIPQLLVRMKSVLQKQMEMSKDSSSDMDYARSALSFDISVLTILENPTMDKLYMKIFNVYYLTVLYEHQHFELDRMASIKEHMAIMKAVVERDHETVRRLIKDHFKKDIKF